MLQEFITVALKLKFTFELEKTDKTNFYGQYHYKTSKQNGYHSLLTIFQNNHYHNNITETIQTKFYNHREKKSATCINVGKYIYYINKLFKKQNVGVIYQTKTNNGRI